MNNIIYGFVTGIAGPSGTYTAEFNDYNDFFNNTNDTSNTWAKGSHDLATNPSFLSVAQVTVTTASTSNSGNTLTKAGATFITSGVVAGRDYVYISATGGTVGVYGILSVDSETQLTLDLAPGTSSGNVSAQITVGRNFAIPPNKLPGFPGAFQAALTTGYNQMGAVVPKNNVMPFGVKGIF